MKRYSKPKKRFFDLEPETVSDIQPEIDSFQRYLKKQMDIKVKTVDEKRARELHPSSFPFCALRHWYEKMLNGGLVVEREMNFGGEFYTSIGTAVHETLQNRLGVGGKIVGNWVCSDRKCKGKREFCTHEKCPVCGKEMHYRELGIEFGKYTKGHVDGLYVYQIKENYIVIDYKTAKAQAITEYQTGVKKHFPYLTNKSQIKAYCFYLQKQYKKLRGKIKGWMLVYISRDDFNLLSIVGEAFTEKDYKESKKKLTLADRNFGIAIDETKVKNIIPLIEDKPCDCAATYQREYHNKYSPCPLKSVCFNESKLKAQLREAEKIYKKRRAK